MRPDLDLDAIEQRATATTDIQLGVRAIPTADDVLFWLEARVDVLALVAEVRRLRQERGRFRAALEHYADQGTWTRLADNVYEGRYRWRGRHGWAVARAALAEG